MTYETQLAVELSNGARITSETDKLTVLEYPKTFSAIWFIIFVLFFFPAAILQVVLYAIQQPKIVTLIKDKK